MRRTGTHRLLFWRQSSQDIVATQFTTGAVLSFVSAALPALGPGYEFNCRVRDILVGCDDLRLQEIE